VRRESFEDIETPAAVVDAERLESNLARWQEHCDHPELANRPHVKTHKCVEIARRRLELGAVGITCQKLSEAERWPSRAATTSSSRSTSSAPRNWSACSGCSGGLGSPCPSTTRRCCPVFLAQPCDCGVLPVHGDGEVGCSLFDELKVTRNGRLETTWRVAARGHSQ
jgi:hypothetical protein